MSSYSDTPLDRLWKEYGAGFQDFDDLTLARWLAQTLSQLSGKAWRLSHPLVGAYRLAAQLAHEQQIWLKRLATPPADFREAPCCRAPMVPLLSRDIMEAGLICQSCNDTCVPFDELPAELQEELRAWAVKYAPLHAVAHWEEGQRKVAEDYQRALDDSADEVESLLAFAGRTLAPQLLQHFPTILWEDQDECLEVRPEDIEL
jgi:hypothetical protein